MTAARGPGGTSGSASAAAMESLYPFLYAGKSDLDAVMEEVRRSTVAKTAEIAALRREVCARDAAISAVLATVEARTSAITASWVPPPAYRKGFSDSIAAVLPDLAVLPCAVATWTR